MLKLIFIIAIFFTITDLFFDIIHIKYIDIKTRIRPLNNILNCLYCFTFWFTLFTLLFFYSFFISISIASLTYILKKIIYK